MKRHWQYLKYVLRHKWFVLLAGLQIGPGHWWLWPLWIVMLLLHDWDKFLPDEWLPYARTFYAPDGSKQYQESIGFARAWMKHQHRNKHHWQFWLNTGSTPLSKTNVLVWDRGTASIIIGRGVYIWDLHGEISVREPMPDLFRREMLADWRGAGRAITGTDNTLDWYLKNHDQLKLHPDTRIWIEIQLGHVQKEQTT